MTYRTRRFRAAIAFTVLGVLGWVGGCSDDSTSPCSDCPPPQGLIVSDPASTASITAGMGTLAARSSSAGDEVAYVSLPPGTAPTGRTTTIHRVGGTEPFNTTLFEGGLDPVPVVAQAGDSIDVVVRDAAGGTVLQARLAVAVRRPPVVVRSEPPRKKTDVPLNAAIMVVFSEPMAGGTLTSSSVQLFRGPSPVAGSVRLLEGTATAAVFVPAAPLDPNTQYRLEVTRAVQDLDGDALPANTTMEFTTGQSLTGPAASIALSPLNIDVGYGLSVFMTGPTYQLTATVRDAAGNQLIDEPVTWSTRDPYSPSNPPGVSVSATGLLTALGPTGFWIVAAAVDGLSAEAPVVVSAGPAASVEVTPSSATVGAAGDTIHLTATVRDALGRLLDTPLVLWLSSAQPLATVTADTSGSAGLSFATVTGVSPGSVTITARRETASGTASVTIIPPLPVASVTVTPATATLLTQVTTQLSATVRDANNKVLAGRPISWTTDNAAVATVNANGLVTGVSEGSAAVTATSEGVSDTAAITVTVPAAAPSGTNAVPLNSRINITWVDNATNETGFRLQRSLDSGAYWATALTIGSPNVTATTDWWPPSEVTVCYRVIAFNAQSDSPPSNVDCTALPEEPTDLAGTAMDAQTVALSWSDNSSVEDGYEVLRSADGGWAYAAVATVPPNSTAFQDGGLTGNLTYSYKVRAIKDSGGSYPSNVIAVPVDPRTPPTAPGLGQPAGFFLGFILLEWSDGPNNQEGYKIEMCYGTTCADADFWVVGTVGATDRSYYVVAPGWGVFSFRVRATNRLGDSPPSNVAYGRTCVEEDYNAPCFP